MRIVRQLINDAATLPVGMYDLQEFVTDRSFIADELVSVMARASLPDRFRERDLATILSRVRDEAIERVYGLFSHPQAPVRARAVRVLLAADLLRQDPRRLIPLIRDDDADVKMEALSAITKLGTAGKVLVPDLLRFIQQENVPELKAHGARALIVGAPDDGAALDGLIALLGMKTDSILLRSSTCHALAAFGPHATPAIPLLERLVLETEDYYLLQDACVVLEAIGVESRHALPSLIAAMRSNPDDRKIFGSAIVAIAVKIAEANDRSSIPILERACYELENTAVDRSLVASLRSLLTDMRARRDGR